MQRRGLQLSAKSLGHSNKYARSIFPQGPDSILNPKTMAGPSGVQPMYPSALMGTSQPTSHPAALRHRGEQSPKRQQQHHQNQ